MSSTTLGLAMRISVLITASFTVASCAMAPTPPTSPSEVPEIRKGTGYLTGYLTQLEMPRSDQFLPEAPRSQAPGSSDEIGARAAFATRGQPRWVLAASDADLKFPAAARVFSCALGFEPDAIRTPHLYMLLRRSMADAGLSTYAAKNRYNRVRPFVALKELSCTPQEEDFLSKDGSYPSGHAAVGWAWALILSDLAPMRREALLRRGYAFGQSRVSCGVHWQSDVDAGRVVGAASVTVIRQNSVFRAQLELARREVATLPVSGENSLPHCAEESSTLVNF